MQTPEIKPKLHIHLYRWGCKNIASFILYYNITMELPTSISDSIIHNCI